MFNFQFQSYLVWTLEHWKLSSTTSVSFYKKRSLIFEEGGCTNVHALAGVRTGSHFVASFTSIPLKRMYSYNRVHIVGYQTQPVEVRKTPGGTSVVDLNLVVPYTFTTAEGQEMGGKSFHVVTLWGGMAEVAGQYVRPGSQLFISGRLQTDSWEDDKKEKRSKTKIIALDMTLLDPKDGQGPAIDNAPHIAAAVNRADVVGNVTRDPEVRTTTSGQQVVSVGVATNDRWKDRQTGEDKERSEFHNIVIWGELANEIARNVKKGNRVYVSGRVQTRSWETKDGSKRTTTEIIAEQCALLGRAHPAALDSISNTAPMRSKKSAGASPAEEAMGVSIPAVKYESEVKVEDLPF